MRASLRTMHIVEQHAVLMSKLSQFDATYGMVGRVAAALDLIKYVTTGDGYVFVSDDPCFARIVVRKIKEFQAEPLMAPHLEALDVYYCLAGMWLPDEDRGG